MDALQTTLDEVALEGLDGITMTALWTRLDTRQPSFPLALDPKTKEFLWTSLVCSEDISIYQLPQERPPVLVYDRFLEIDPETGIQEMRRMATREQKPDVYPISVVTDDPAGIQGSCLYYRERKDISGLIRTNDFSPKLTLKQSQSRWGDKLVLVASQNVRYHSLIGYEGNPEIKLSDHSYCILERLGRARWQGELQRDLHTCVFKIDAGKLHYLRKSLDKNGLITLQSHVVRLPSGGQQVSILLLLKRFHVDRRSKYDILMETTSNILSQMPNKTCIMLKLRDQLHICDRTFKRMYQYMLAAKLVTVLTLPLQELNPDAGPCKTKRGTNIRVRCLKLLRPYGHKEIDDDYDDNDEDGPVRRSTKGQARDIERDLLTQAYEIVVQTGPKGISQSALREQLNIGKLESRMVCRVLERNNMIKGFMEDEGRQRTTKYISKLYVEQSALNLQFAKERERSEKLRLPQLTTPIDGDVHPECTLPCPEDTPGPEDLLHPKQDEDIPKDDSKELGEGQARGRMSKGRAAKKSKSMMKESPTRGSVSSPSHSTPLKIKQPQRPQATGKSLRKAELSEGVEKDDSLLSLDANTHHACSIVHNQSENAEESVTVVEEILSKPEQNPGKKRGSEHHETYRLLKRKNMIIETVRNQKIIEGLYPLQRKLMEEEKQDGVNTKVCKKSIIRLTRSLAQDGYLKLFRTTVIQDGVSKKVEFVVHPSVTADDPLMKSAIEQIRFRISSSYTVHRLKKEEEKVSSLAQETDKGDSQSSAKSVQGKTEEKMGVEELKNFKPSIIPGLSRSLGFQPKMPRFRVVHTLLWYLIYGHPLNQSTPNESPSPTLTPESGVGNSAQDVPPSSTETDPTQDTLHTPVEDDQFKVYVNELSWKRFIPPLPVHRDYGHGWALISDILISLPLSVYVQVIQINYKVDGLEDFLNDPVKQHYLVKFLPSSLKTQLLHRRKYFFSFCESLQKLCFMGLLHFGPTEKFMDKDQVFIFLKTRATIVDTTVCEPHYNLAIETRPFDRRRYTFSTPQDLENYWFDLLCVCLNTPLGVIRARSRQGEGDEDREGEEPDVAVGTVRHERLQYTLNGSRDVIDDGVTPGDRQGAGGLDSSFFSHLKRNWIWTTHVLNKPKKPGESQTVRLRNLLSKHPFPKSVCAVIQSRAGKLVPPAVLEEEVQLAKEPQSRNQQGRGGKWLKRKRPRKENSKPVKKKRKVVSVRKQTLCQDETDRKALMLMTRQRVSWTHLEDSVLMLCRVASHFLNRKIKRPFVAWNVVRDILHKELETSLDKTSLSVGRRSRYIMKNPQTHLNYRICLAEVYQDKALVEGFMNRTNSYEDPQVCAQEFNEFVSALRSKFSSSYGASDVVIPDTKEELFHKFKVYAIGEEPATRITDVLTSKEDIHTLVLNNLIQSTLVLSNSQMKSCRSFQSFSLYSRYDAEVLQHAFQDCKRRGLVNRRRANKVLGPRKGRAVPFLAMSYQLSQHYYRYFTWRFPSTVYNEVYDLLEVLQHVQRADRPHTFSFQRGRGSNTSQVEQPDGGLQQSGGEATEPLVPPSDVEDMVLFPIDAPGGASACCLSLMTLGLLAVDVSIPQQVVVVDSTLVDNEVVKSITKELDEEEEGDEAGRDEERRARVQVKARQASHTNYLLMKGYFIPGIISLRNINSSEHVAVNSCTVHIQLRKSASHTLFRESDSTLALISQSRASALPATFTRVLGRDRSCGRSWVDEGVAMLGYTPSDVEAGQLLRAAVEKEAEFGIDRRDLCRRFSHLEQVEENRSRSLQQYIQDLIEMEELVEVGALTARLVCVEYSAPWLLYCPTHVREEAPPTPLHPTLKRPSLPWGTVDDPPLAKRPAREALPPTPHQQENDAMETTEISSVKSAAMATVTLETVAPIVECSEKGCDPSDPPTSDRVAGEASASRVTDGPPQTEQDPASGEGLYVESSENDVLRFVARPWRIVDGSLNRPVCKGMLEALLLHVMSQPGVQEHSLLQHYSGVLQPVIILELLQVLIELGCVKKRFTLNRPKVSLFSRPSAPQVRGQGEVSVSEEVVAFYEPTVDCSVRLAHIFPHETSWNRWVQLCVR
ncbi:general transcription factor 3C polypeptide 1 [Electrophorus electricus]|uniref:general transcription factor 3C polypeptide 1 n=1 Tax=Electrophorus electricus TaxID=8005 RepID=UPI0015CFA291|nr:general transcription factor 3C polypeptide 1 [Electrophorus electricus]